MQTNSWHEHLIHLMLYMHLYIMQRVGGGGVGGGETATAPPLATSLNPQVGYEIEINRKRSHCQPRLGAIVS